MANISSDPRNVSSDDVSTVLAVDGGNVSSDDVCTTLTVDVRNVSSDDDSATLTDNYVVAVACVSSVNVILTFVAVMTLYRCKRMSFQIKRLSYNFFLSDTFFNVFIVITCTWQLALGNDQLFSAVITSAISTALPISLASVVGITLDRLVAITQPMRYQHILNKRAICVITLFIWLIHPAALILMFILSVTFSQCDLHFYGTFISERFAIQLRIVFATFYVIYHSFIICAYLKIVQVIRKQVQAMATLMSGSNIQNVNGRSGYTGNRYFSTTITIAKIVLTSELTSLPTLLYSLFFAVFPNLHTHEAAANFQGLSYLCYCGNLYACLFIYVWKMKECKFVFLSTFCRWNKKCRDKALRLKIEVYQIVTNTGHAMTRV